MNTHVSYEAAEAISEGQVLYADAGKAKVATAATNSPIGVALCDAKLGEQVLVCKLGSQVYALRSGTLAVGNSVRATTGGAVVAVTDASYEGFVVGTVDYVVGAGTAGQVRITVNPQYRTKAGA